MNLIMQKMTNFFKTYYYGITLIFVFTILYIINFPLDKYWLGGDAFPIFYTTDFIYRQPFVWLTGSGFGGVGTTGAYLNYIPLTLLIDFFKNIFGDLKTQYFFNFILFILLPIGFYFFSEIFSNDKKTRLVITFFYALNFLVWFGIARNIIFITLFFSLTPIIVKIIYDYLMQEQKRQIQEQRQLLYLLIIGIFNSMVTLNPAFFIVQLITIFIFIGWLNLKIKVRFKDIFLVFVFLYALSIITIISSLIFFTNNTSVEQDEWNTKILLEGPLNAQKTGSALYKTFRGLNQDVFASYGWLRGEQFYPFPSINIFNNNLISILLFIPTVIIILGFITISEERKKYYKYYFAVFVITLFFFKSTAAPLGFIFEHLIKNYSLFGIFRNPHQKLSLLFILTQAILLLIFLGGIKKERLKNAFLICIIIYTTISGIHYFTGNFIPKNNLVLIPGEYKETADYLNSDDTVHRILLIPWEDSTWTITDFRYEGYSLFNYLLSDKQIYNRNSLSFSKYNSLFIDKFRPHFVGYSDNLSGSMYNLQVDTLIYDGYVNRTERFHVKEEPGKILKYLDSQKNVYLEKDFGRIKIYRLNKKMILPIIGPNNTIYQKISPVKQRIYIKDIKHHKDLYFLESYHEGWKLYLQENPTHSWCKHFDNMVTAECEYTQKFFEGEELSYLWKKPLFDDVHRQMNEYANGWIIDPGYIKKNYPREFYKENSDGSIDIEMVIYFKPQSYFYLGLITSGFIVILCVRYLYLKRQIRNVRK